MGDNTSPKTNRQKLDDLTKDVQSLTFDNERIVKPALEKIQRILESDAYATKASQVELKAEVEAIKNKLDVGEDIVKNYPLVEKLVFGMVGIILVAVIGALIALVVTRPHP